MSEIGQFSIDKILMDLKLYKSDFLLFEEKSSKVIEKIMSSEKL